MPTTQRSTFEPFEGAERVDCLHRGRPMDAREAPRSHHYEVSKKDECHQSLTVALGVPKHDEVCFYPIDIRGLILAVAWSDWCYRCKVSCQSSGIFTGAT
jgi:hypothetical protein